MRYEGRENQVRKRRKYNNMKRFILFLVMFLVMGCGICKRVQYVPVETKIDSIVVEKIVERTDTVSIEVPGERVYVIKQDSSHLETAVATSDAKIDSTGMLHHSLENKDVNLKKEIVYIDRIIEKRVEVEKEVPVEVEVTVKYVPDYYKWINIIFWCMIGTGLIFVIFKMKSFFHIP